MIIQSLLDTDLYKFTMMQAVLHNFPDAEVEYTFKNRTKNVNLLPFKEEIQRQIKFYCTLIFHEHELNFMSNIRFFKKDFIQFLKIFQPDEKYVNVYEEDGDLAIKVSGPWLHTILFEVPILAIVNEVYNNSIPKTSLHKNNIIEITKQKFDFMQENKIMISEFGTRRRESFETQKTVIDTLLGKYGNIYLLGTSNVYFAKEFGLTPIGTMAHEWLQAGQALGVRVIDSQKFMLETWVKEYRGDLGIALTDVIGVDAFIRDFDLYFAKLYDGVRHDSGDPFIFGDKIIRHYKNLKIDPKTKTIIFSDGLDMKLANDLNNYFNRITKVSFGIGTNLTNDKAFGGFPLQTVMKLTKVNGSPVAKISDSKGKSMCPDIEYENYVKKVFGVSK